MRVVQFLHNSFSKSSFKLDNRILKSLFACTDGLLRCQTATLVSMGRAITSSAKIKHKIKQVDRLLGNKKLQEKRLTFYKLMTPLIIGSKKQPIIVIDWSGLTPCGQYHLLRAAVPISGRSLTIFETAYPESKYGSRSAHQEFLKALREVLPKDCRPIIVTDAGYRCPWFKLVINMEWNFVGRVRHDTQYQSSDNEAWLPCKSLYKKATTVAKYLGCFLLAKSNPTKCHFYTIKQRKKHRVKKNLKGKKVKCSVSKKHEKSGREPWLIVSSLPHTRTLAKKIIRIYKLRMGIEEGFRDMKNTRNGLGYRHSRTLIKERINIIMLIIALATFTIWIIGIQAGKGRIGIDLQTNSLKSRKVLSTFFIGAYLCSKQTFKLLKKEIISVLKLVQEQVYELS